MKRHGPIVGQAGQRHIVGILQHKCSEGSRPFARRKFADRGLEASDADKAGRTHTPRAYIDFFAIAPRDPVPETAILRLRLLDERPNPQGRAGPHLAG